MKQEKDSLDSMRHSTSHLMAAAVLELFPDTKFAIGPSIEDGFYYDFEFSKPLVEEDLKRIEKEMIDITTSKINKGFFNLLKKIKNGPILFFSAIEFGPYSLNLLTASSVVRPVNLFSFCLTIIL